MQDFSIIIVTHKRQEMLGNLLDNLSDSNAASIFVVINNDSSDYTSLKNKFPQMEWLEGKFQTPGLARNHALEKVTTSWTLFLDDDARPSKNYFQMANDILEKESEKLVCFGGPDHPPLEKNLFQEAINLTLQSPMATAHTRLRHLKGKKDIQSGKESNLILCHLWLKSSFQREHDIWFSSKLFRNEENLFISELLSKKGEAKYYSDLFVHHHRKVRLDKLAKAVFSSGFNRVKSFHLSKDLFHFLFLVPAIWVLYLMSLPFLPSNRLTIAPLQAYITLSLFFMIKLGREKPQHILLALFYQVFINILYGLGVLFGGLWSLFWFFNLKLDR